MTVLVKKFGGSSLANLDRINHVANIIAESHAKGHKQVVVVSAMYGETDRLIDHASSFDRDVNPREYAVLVSTGEQIAMSLLCMTLTSKGLNAKSFSASQANIYTDSNHLSANITNIDCNNIHSCIDKDQIAVVAGFQGIDKNGDITTLGRGGSDTTAVALAVKLNADECRIYTDVDGIYTADPKIVPKAKHLRSISHEEMLVLSRLGAKVMQSRSVELAKKYNMTVKVLSSFHTSGGTDIVSEVGPMECPVVTAISSLSNLVKFVVPMPSVNTSKFLKEIANAGISLEMLQLVADIASSSSEISFLCIEECYKLVQKISEKYIDDTLTIGHNILKNKAVLSVVGLGLKGHNIASVGGILVDSLHQNGIKIEGMIVGDIQICLLLDIEYIEDAVRISHSVLGLEAS